MTEKPPSRPMSAGPDAEAPDAALDYETAKRLARDPDPAVRRQAAAHPGTRPELLYYLADDPDPEVRRTVGARLAAAPRAARLAIQEGDVDLRRTLAVKLARLLGDLPADAQGDVYRHTVETLYTLARDHAVAVREALAATLKDVALAPPAVVQTLARDAERAVAEPILQFCVALTEADLLDIIARQPQPWVLDAIAQRNQVSAPVADAIYAAGNEPAVRRLLDNPGAAIAEPTLARMVEDSQFYRSWQAPLARRPRLPRGLALRLAEFVDRTVLELLRQRSDFDAETVAEVAAVVRRRLEWIEDRRADESAVQHAQRMQREGRLSETVVADALAWGDLDFVHAALALRTRIAPALVAEILASQSPKGITALAWRAGLGMRVAIQLQIRAGNIPPHRVLNARDGTEYPLSAADMTWQLEFYGIAP